MPKFRIQTTCRATIREHWQVEATDLADAQRQADLIAGGTNTGDFIQSAPDETIGDEEEREVELVEAIDETDPVARALAAARALVWRMTDDKDRPEVCTAWNELRIALLSVPPQ